jgi:heme O synthase-like polyprenyltransferase
MTFNIGNQTAGVVNNVAGDQRITGGQQGTVVTTDAARQALQSLRAAVASAPLDPGTSAAAETCVTEIDDEMRRTEPARPRVADGLRRLTEILLSAGSLASAGVALTGPIRILASWLGGLGEPIVRMLPLFA